MAYRTAEQRADRERKRAAARQRVYKRLAQRHPAEFTDLYEAELKEAGLWPRQSPGPPPRPVSVLALAWPVLLTHLAVGDCCGFPDSDPPWSQG